MTNLPRPLLANLAILLGVWTLCVTASGAEEFKFRPQQISDRLTVGYAVRLVDVNADGRQDIVVVDTERVVWFESPKWELHTIIEHATKKDNVSIAPADIDGDGQLDFALAADWRPSDTRTSGSLQWLKRGAKLDDPWTVHPIATEPTIHRIRFVDLDADGREELIVVPLFGRNSTPPNFAETPVRILAYPIPADPVRGPWKPQVLDETTHVTHNFWPTDLNADGKLDLLLASFEGVSLLERQDSGPWSRTRIGAGNQATSPSRGASEIKHGRLANKSDYLATIEPWHGHQVVVYTRPAAAQPAANGLWPRQVLDEELKWGHAVTCVDLDGDGDEELAIGVRDTLSAERPCGLRIYDPTNPQGTVSQGTVWQRTLVDPAGVAIEDLTAGDLNADGRTDLIAVGRATKNVRIYWNETEQKTAKPPVR